MINEALILKGIRSHCPLCGTSFGDAKKTQEHIFPRWLQKKHSLETRVLNLPNFLGKNYKSVRVEICQKCNNERFGRLESIISKPYRSEDSFNEIIKVDAFQVAAWLGKILWLLCRKGNSHPDYRSRDDDSERKVIPEELMPGATYVGLFLRCYAMNKKMYSYYLGDPPAPEFYNAPFSLYALRVDTTDGRFESFDFSDDMEVLGVSIRSGNLGLICVFDGGLHSQFRSHLISDILPEKLHPTQFSELTARIFYDGTVLHEAANRVEYFWNENLNSVIAQNQLPRSFNPYMSENHDPYRLASYISKSTMVDPKKLLYDDGRMFTTLRDSAGGFLKYAVTEDELESARRDANLAVTGPLDARFRTNQD